MAATGHFIMKINDEEVFVQQVQISDPSNNTNVNYTSASDVTKDVCSSDIYDDQVVAECERMSDDQVEENGYCSDDGSSLHSRRKQHIASPAASIQHNVISEDLYSTDQQRTLGEILTYCQVMYEAIQKLNEKIDCLQVKVGNVQSMSLQSQKCDASSTESVQHEMFQKNMTESGAVMPPLIRATSPYPHLQTTAKKPPTLYLAPGLRSPSESQFLDKETQSSRVIIPIKTEESTDSEFSKENPDNIPQPSDSKSKSKCKSLLASLSSQPSNSATVLIGDHKRKVRIAKSVIQKVCHKSNPRNAVRFLLRGLFTNETLTCSNVMGDTVRGLKKLDPNKIAAIREWLAEKFPNYNLRENGKDWKACISIMNSMARYMRFEARKQKRLWNNYDDRLPVNKIKKIPKTEKRVEKSKSMKSAEAEICVEIESDEDAEIIPSTSGRQRKRAAAPVKSIEQRGKQWSPAPSHADLHIEISQTYLGDPRRKVKIAQTIIQEANLRKRPELIARFLIKYLFTKEVLVKSNVNGIKDRGTAALDPNTIGALREYLKGRFPYLQMSEDGKDWKVCIGAINSAIRKIRYEEKLKGEFLESY
uniref:BEN domain-containing protein n=1 Tax=Erpetoichthys calabaricus TaxID=27687 RepID=A0A8C4X3K6_ERPCA